MADVGGNLCIRCRIWCYAAAGIDAFQEVWLTLKMVGASVYVSLESNRGAGKHPHAILAEVRHLPKDPPGRIDVAFGLADSSQLRAFFQFSAQVIGTFST